MKSQRAHRSRAGASVLAALVCVSFAFVAGARADRFVLDDARVSALRSYAGEGPVVIVQLGSVGVQPRAVGAWVLDSAKLAEQAGGRRVYTGNLDVAPPGHPLRRFELLTIDAYPSAEAASQALTTPLLARERALAELVLLMARPRFDRLEPLLEGSAPERPAGTPEPPPLELPPGMEPAGGGFDPDMAQSFMAEDQSASLMVLELVRYRDRAVGDGAGEASGEEAWVRYWNATATRLMLHGGRPVWSARSPRLLLGGEHDALDVQWSGIDLLYAPDRLVYRALFASAAQRESLRVRATGVERGVVLPGTPWPGSDPAR